MGTSENMNEDGSSSMTLGIGIWAEEWGEGARQRVTSS